MAYKGTIRFGLRCPKHPRFDPGQGENGIRGGCLTCYRLLDAQKEVFAFKRRLVAISDEIAMGVTDAESKAA